MGGELVSNKRRIKANRNLRILLARFHSEHQAHGAGAYTADIRHDPGCPGLARQSMLACTCKPEMVIRKVV
jgi:hypothetical protein